MKNQTVVMYFFLDDVVEAKIEGVKMMKGKENPELIKIKEVL